MRCDCWKNTPLSKRWSPNRLCGTLQVAVPAGYKYIPLHETPFPEPDKMAKAYPFTLDPFQRESIRCIERGEVVRADETCRTFVADTGLLFLFYTLERAGFCTHVRW